MSLLLTTLTTFTNRRSSARTRRVIQKIQTIVLRKPIFDSAQRSNESSTNQSLIALFILLLAPACVLLWISRCCILKPTSKARLISWSSHDNTTLSSLSSGRHLPSTVLMQRFLSAKETRFANRYHLTRQPKQPANCFATPTRTSTASAVFVYASLPYMDHDSAPISLYINLRG